MKLLALLALAAPAAAQATIHVPGDEPTIQAAVAAAAPGDTVLVAPGTYVEQVDFLGKAITVRSTAGAAVTTIDSAGARGWPDFPFGAVVRMVGGEGPDSVLQGFTVTGGSSGPGGGPGHSGVWCAGLSPTVRACVITGNSGGLGGGVRGDAILEGCTVAGNDSLPYGEGGGVYGQPTIVDSVISGNHSGDRGGGLFATGPCTVTGSVVEGNVSGNGADGYTGGGVFGPATLVDCLVVGNTAQHYFSGGPPDELGTGVDGAVALVGCTVADNLVGGGPVPGEESGGIRNVQTVVDSILWGNEGQDVAVSATTDITYSIVGGGYPGVGNLDLNPAFVDAAGGDYFLTPGSPAIDAGSPASPLDPDGTPADLGALTFPQFPAAVAERNGTGVNPGCYTTVLDPVLGGVWTGSVDATAHGFAGDASLLLGYAGPSPPLLLGAGELLVDLLSPQVFTSAELAVGGLAVHTLPVPASYALGGLTVYTQAVVVEVGGAVGLCNALDLTLGL